MEANIKSKVKDFISILLDSKLELITFDIYTTEKYKTKKHWYSLEVDTKTPQKPITAGSFSFASLSTQIVRFSVCVDDGCIILEKDDYATFKDSDVDFAKECAMLIEEKYIIKQATIVNDIVTSTNTELKLNRENNISKLKL